MNRRCRRRSQSSWPRTAESKPNVSAPIQHRDAVDPSETQKRVQRFTDGLRSGTFSQRAALRREQRSAGVTGWPSLKRTVGTFIESTLDENACKSDQVKGILGQAPRCCLRGAQQAGIEGDGTASPARGSFSDPKVPCSGRRMLIVMHFAGARTL